MPPEKTDDAALWDMLTAARAITSFIQNRTYEEYLNDLLLRSAVERQIEIIGEAARNVSRDFQDSHPEIAWRPIMAQRHVLAHDYGEVLNDRIWRVATIHVPELISLLEPLVPPNPPDDVP